MFNKLLSNVAVNPSALNQFAFYSKRLRKEQSIRRLGLFFIISSMIVQIFASIIPAEKSLAYSDNHIINGIKTRQDIIKAWDRSGSDVSSIYSKFGVTRQDIMNLPEQPNATIRSTANNNYWSIGRNSLTGYRNVENQYKNQEIALSTSGPTVYMRPLHAWDSGSYSTYKAFKGRSSTTGEAFWILVDCGNYTQVGKTIKEEPPKKPVLEARKSVISSSSQIKAGDTFKFKIEYRNSVPDSLAEDVVLEDQLDLNKLELISPTNLVSNSGKITYKAGNLKFTSHTKAFNILVRLKGGVAGGTNICNVATLRASNASTVTIGGEPSACVSIAPEPTPAGPAPSPVVPTTAPQPEKQPQPVKEEQPEEEVPPSLSKDVKNVTKNLIGNNALNTTVNAGDVLEYTLTTSNTHTSDITEYDIKDYVGDILDYAEVDLEFLGSQGGIFDKSANEVVWAKQKLPAKSEAIKVFRVKVKNPVPSTNSPSTVSTGFDCKISNQYGDEITLQVECPVIKGIEELPNTGPGTTIGATFTVTALSGYFFAWARLLAKESGVIKRIYQQTGQG